MNLKDIFSFDSRYRLRNAMSKIEGEDGKNKFFDNLRALYTIDPQRKAFFMISIILFSAIFFSYKWAFWLLSFYALWFVLFYITWLGVYYMYKDEIKKKR